MTPADAVAPRAAFLELIHMPVIARAFAATLASVILAGCSITLPVRGTSEIGDDTFSGTATGYMDHSGNLKIVTSGGIECLGDFVYVTSRTGQGVFTCSDRRSGPFDFVSTGRHGTGTATLGGKRYTFTFG